MDCDVVVVGAGVAGLAATASLSQFGYEVRCLEATDRVGGRILTVHDPLAPVAIELGAEFVHGQPREIWDIIHSSHLTAYEHTVRALYFARGRVIKSAEIGKLADQLFARMARSSRKKDESFEQYLHHSRLPEDTKTWVRKHVEGFNAARSESISVQALVKEANAADKIDGDRVARIVDGYDTIPMHLLRSIPKHESIVRLGSAVQQIHWRPGSVEVLFRSLLGRREERWRCRGVIVTVPLGVLQANLPGDGAIGFDPRPERILQAAQSLQFGTVYRVTFRFAQTFWERDPKLKNIGFLVSQNKYFPTWWTTHPVESPILTAWMAGSAAEDFQISNPSQIAGEALASLDRILNGKVPEPEAVYFHDWRRDPYIRGAYSYVPVGTRRIRETLATPVEDTLFFAGEAANVDGHASTVHGAIASGRRAAELIHRSRSLRPAGNGNR